MTEDFTSERLARGGCHPICVICGYLFGLQFERRTDCGFPVDTSPVQEGN